MSSADAAPTEAPMPAPVAGFHYTRFPPRLPVLNAGVEAQTHRVAIVGGGPVGMALALGLAQQGVPSVVVEADDTVCVGSRAICISRRSLEIIERLGALPAFLAKGLPWAAGRSFYRDVEVLRFEMPSDPQQKLPPMINIAQYHIEQYLLDAIERLNAQTPGLIDLRWATELTHFEQNDAGTTLHVRNALGAYALQADWLVACDGGQSQVRKQLDLPLVGTGYEGRYLIVDIELPSTHQTERRAWFDPPWYRGSTVLMHPQPDHIWRIDYQLLPGQDTEAEMRPEAVKAFVQKHLDAIGEGHLPWRPVWTSVYRAGAMTLQSYRHGRVLFAGNAAHAMPIFGVRGLNSGLDDADNLAWKLASVVQGVSGTALLDSYSQERIAAFHINAESAMRSTEFMSPPSRGFDLMREAALSLAERHRAIAQLVNPRQTSAVHYAESALSSPSDALTAGPAPGEVMPEQPLLSGHLSDHLRGDFTLLVLQPAHAAAVLPIHVQPPAGVRVRTLCLSDGGQEAAPHLAGATVLPCSPAVLKALGGDEQGAVYLLRPDGHVAARWRQPSAEQVTQALQRASLAQTMTQPELEVA